MKGFNIDTKSFKSIAVIVFLLLGVLFGMQIMAFIFGNLGPTQAGLTANSAAYNTSATIQNNSLTALQTYTAGASNQMSIVLIVITLILLVVVFAFFWNVFVSGHEGKSGSPNYGA